MRSPADSALIYDVISGAAPVDRFTAAPLAGPLSQAATAERKPRRIMVSSANPMRGPQADGPTLDALRRSADALATLGHDVVWADPEYPKLGLAFQGQVACGVHDEASRVEHPDLLERHTRQLLALSAPMRALGGWAERRGAELAATFLPHLFDGVDALVTPTTPCPAVPIGQKDGAGILTLLRKAGQISSYTSAWNVLGNPAAAVPAGLSADGLPLSVQIVGPGSGEAVVVELAAQLEAARPWAGQRPPLDRCLS